MRFIYGKNDFRTLKRAEENCYLLTNGLGGFSSQTIAGSSARADHTLFMAALTAPNKRYQIIAGMREEIVVDGEKYELSSQEFLDDDKQWKGFVNIESFSYEYLPEFVFKAGPAEVVKTIVMRHGENTLGIKYEVNCNGKHDVRLSVTPLLHFSPKGKMPSEDFRYQYSQGVVTCNGIELHFATDGECEPYKTECVEEMYYRYDERDGRNHKGMAYCNHTVNFEGAGTHHIIYTVPYNKELKNVGEYNIDTLIREEESRKRELEKVAGLEDEAAKCLVVSANDYITHRESTGGKSILAGFPFFEDWGRDTMIAVLGCAISTRQFDTAKSILNTFMKYCHKGIMPNLFPEGKDAPMYNTVDASLLFVNAVYEYYKATEDKEFVKSAYIVIEDIIRWYIKGTDFHIKMDEDGLIMAGSDLEQLTWMDVRVGKMLPTPRHGKPVEINAYWYNALMVADYFSDILSKEKNSTTDYKSLAHKVKESFREKFWNEENECLNDLASGLGEDRQIRCNQIWAASMPFTMLDENMALAVIDKVYEKLYTSVGLRTLSVEDKEFHPVYVGPMEERDMAYHQGTTWGFPLGAYYLAYLRWAKDKERAAKTVKRQLYGIVAALREGCIGHLAEIYDGLVPTDSKGCFAQAWSVAEILRVYEALEK